MTFPPLVARVRVGKGAFPLWLPIVLVWAPLLALAAPLLAIALLVGIVAAPRFVSLALAGGLWRAFCGLRGASVELESGRRRLFIALC